MASGAQAVSVERPQSQVDAHMGCIGNSLSELELQVSELIGAIGSVSRSEPQMTTKDAPKSVGEVLVPLASSMRDFTNRIQELSSAVNQARGRLEL